MNNDSVDQIETPKDKKICIDPDQEVCFDPFHTLLCKGDLCASAIMYFLSNNPFEPLYKIYNQFDWCWTHEEVHEGLTKLHELGFLSFFDITNKRVFAVNQGTVSKATELLSGSPIRNMSIRWALNQKGITANDKTVLVTIAQYCNENYGLNRRFNTSTTELADLCLLRAQQVKCSLSSLKELGLIKVNHSPETGPRVSYSLNIDFEEINHENF